MNLYKIDFDHFSPKDSERGTRNLLLAENDEQVYEWIKTAEGIYTGWEDYEKYTWNEDAETFVDEYGEGSQDWYDTEGKPEPFKNRMLRLKGEINDEDYEPQDAYYGVTIWGWELLLENVDKKDYTDLIKTVFLKTIE